MKKYILLSIIVFASALAQAQVSVRYAVGYGTFGIGELQDALQSRMETVKTMYEDATLTNNYSNSAMMHTFALEYATGNEVYGLEVTFNSTKGQIDYTDEGISVQEKSTLSGIRIGTLYRRYLMALPVTKKKKLLLYGEMSPGLIITNLNYNDAPISKDEEGTVVVDKIGGSTVSISLLPKVGIMIPVLDKLGLNVAVGYDLSLSGSIEKMDYAKVGWAGFRANAGLSYSFN